MFSNLFLLTLTLLSEAGHPDLASVKGSSPTLEEEFERLKDGLPSFSEAMRKILPEASAFNPSGIENTRELTSRTKEPFLYVDFMGEEGYAVLAQNWEMPLFKAKGQLVFSPTDPIAYSRDQGLVRLEGDEEIPLEQGGVYPRAEQSGTYAGQESGAQGEGKIIDPNLYVQDRYGSSWNWTTLSLQGWNTYHQQNEFSIYQRHEDDGTSLYENNCLLASLYEHLDYYRRIGSLSSLPSYDVSANVHGDYFYSSFMAETTASGTPRYSLAHTVLPAIYKTIRDYFRDQDSYTFGPATTNKAIDCITYLNTHYSIALASRLMLSWDFDTDIRDSFPVGQRLYIWNQTYGTYPAHSMPVCGVYQFNKTSGWWLFQHTDYVNLLKVNDNQVNSPRYIDLSVYVSQYPNSGSFIEIKPQ